jgi:CRP/FNR family transcriptional regulator, cyclic AMP receptor protein
MLDVLDRAIALHQAPLFAALSPDELLPLAELCADVDLDAGERLFAEGEPGDSLYVVALGRVAVEQGGQRVAELGVGECVGELAALDWEPRSATVVALEPCELVRLERDDLLDQLGDHPEILQALAVVLTARLRVTQRPR